MDTQTLLNDLAAAAEGLDLRDAEDRATFRQVAFPIVATPAWDDIKTVARGEFEIHVGTADRYQINRAILDGYIARWLTANPKPVTVVLDEKTKDRIIVALAQHLYGANFNAMADDIIAALKEG